MKNLLNSFVVLSIAGLFAFTFANTANAQVVNNINSGYSSAYGQSGLNNNLNSGYGYGSMFNPYNSFTQPSYQPNYQSGLGYGGYGTGGVVNNINSGYNPYGTSLNNSNLGYAGFGGYGAYGNTNNSYLGAYNTYGQSSLGYGLFGCNTGCNNSYYPPSNIPAYSPYDYVYGPARPMYSPYGYGQGNNSYLNLMVGFNAGLRF